MPKKKTGKKKGKKVKLKKDDDHAARAIFTPVPKSPQESLYNCLTRLRWWLGEDSASIDAYFHQCGKDLFSVEEFMALLRYLQAPISPIQLNLALKYLDDSHSGFIDQAKFNDIRKKDDHELLNISHTTSLVDPIKNDDQDEHKITKSKKKGKKNEKNKKEISKPDKLLVQRDIEEPRYVDVRLVLANFKDYKKHPGHFSVSITTSTTIHGMSQLIQAHLNETVTSVAIFKESLCTKDSYLNPSWTLESCGVEGGELQYKPTTYQLYYDYIPVLMDSPLLMADNTMRYVPCNALK